MTYYLFLFFTSFCYFLFFFNYFLYLSINLSRLIYYLNFLQLFFFHFLLLSFSSSVYSVKLTGKNKKKVNQKIRQKIVGAQRFQREDVCLDRDNAEKVFFFFAA